MLKRREFLKLCAGAALAGPAPELDGAESRPESKCLPVISGTLWWCSPEQSRSWGATGWIKELQEQQELEFDLLWLVQGPRLIGNEFSLRQLLDVCARRQIQVIVDTGSTSNWYAPLDLKKELELCRQNIGAVGEQLAGHPAFFGWYIPHEIYMDWGVMHDYVSHLYPALAEACKRAAALPVTLSPFFILDRTKVFGDFRFNEPDEYGDYWGKLIQKSGLDIVMMQDSGEHFSYVQDAQRRPFFEAMSKACRASGARFWGNVEVAEMECPSIEEYVRRYGRVHHSAAKGIPWRSVPMDRLRSKLALAAEYAERIVSWGYQEFCRPSLGPTASKWYESYRAYRRQIAPKKGAPAAGP
jgi:Domain of unknown function (DUF4434)